jgi:hypothetical protein
MRNPHFEMEFCTAVRAVISIDRQALTSSPDFMTSLEKIASGVSITRYRPNPAAPRVAGEILRELRKA